VHFLRIVTSGGFCVSFVFSHLKKRIAKITGNFYLNMPHFLFFFIALAFMDGHYLDCTATPKSPVSGSRATIENVAIEAGCDAASRAQEIRLNWTKNNSQLILLTCIGKLPCGRSQIIISDANIPDQPFTQGHGQAI
jgi:hypothetical protein